MHKINEMKNCIMKEKKKRLNMYETLRLNITISDKNETKKSIFCTYHS